MKDYYKILGVKEDACVDEIRERWIELMKQYHPDRGKVKGAEGKIEEINEAYQALKFSSTRVPYDLKRAHDRKKRRAFGRRVVLAIAFPVLITMVFLLNIFFFKKPQVSLEQKVTPSSVNNPESVRDSSPEGAVVSLAQTDKTSESAMSRKDKTEQRDSHEGVSLVGNSKGAMNPAGMILRSAPAVDHRGVGPEEVEIKGKEIFAEEPRAMVLSSSAKAEISENSLSFPVQMDQVPPASLNSQPEQMDPSPRSSKADSAPMVPVSNEEEIKQFYANYVERYTHKDIEGFLSCFSARAVQNRTARLDEIRKIYANFFSVSDELRYYMEGMRIASNQNYTDVRAFYVVDQVVKGGGESKTWRGAIRWTLVREEGSLRILSLDYQQQKSP